MQGRCQTKCGKKSIEAGQDTRGDGNISDGERKRIELEEQLLDLEFRRLNLEKRRIELEFRKAKLNYSDTAYTCSRRVSQSSSETSSNEEDLHQISKIKTEISKLVVDSTGEQPDLDNSGEFFMLLNDTSLEEHDSSDKKSSGHLSQASFTPPEHAFSPREKERKFGRNKNHGTASAANGTNNGHSRNGILGGLNTSPTCGKKKRAPRSRSERTSQRNHIGHHKESLNTSEQAPKRKGRKKKSISSPSLSSAFVKNRAATSMSGGSTHSAHSARTERTTIGKSVDAKQSSSENPNDVGSMHMKQAVDNHTLGHSQKDKYSSDLSPLGQSNYSSTEKRKAGTRKKKASSGSISHNNSSKHFNDCRRSGNSSSSGGKRRRSYNRKRTSETPPISPSQKEMMPDNTHGSLQKLCTPHTQEKLMLDIKCKSAPELLTPPTNSILKDKAVDNKYESAQELTVSSCPNQDFSVSTLSADKVEDAN